MEKFFKELGRRKERLALKAEKVELGLVDDISKDIDRIDKSFREAHEKRDLAQRLMHNTAAKAKNGIDFVDDVLKKAKELGVEIKIAEQAKTRYKSIKEEAEGYAKKLK